MAEEEERTEDPTSKRIQDARADGNVPKSQDVATWFPLLVSILLIVFLFHYTFDNLSYLFRYYFSFFGQEITKNSVIVLALVTMKYFALIIMPFVLPLLFVGIAAHVGQYGFLFTTKNLFSFDLSKINPFTNIKNIISVAKVIEGFKMTMKVFVIFGIAFYYFIDDIKELPKVALYTISSQLSWFKEKSLILSGILLLILLVFAVWDFAWTRHKYTKSLKMTKQEVKDEMKNMEGDPRVKNKIRQIQFQMHKKRMMANIPQASVVVTNPTHYAVALKYEEGDRAPVVVASGVDNIAMKIKEIAMKHNIPIYEDPPLARQLYKDVKLDQEIPPALYQAVVAVLVFVKKSNRFKN
jgi:flagellar biosynthesis protein FlhB